MITKMTRYSFVLLGEGKDRFLNEIQELGVVDITRHEKEYDETGGSMMREIEDIRKQISEIKAGSDSKLESMTAHLGELRNEEAELSHWGDFDKEALDSLGIGISFFSASKKKFNPSWADEFPMEVISEDGKNVYFVVLGETPDIPAELLPSPQKSVSKARLQIEETEDRIEAYRRKLEDSKKDIPDLEKKIADKTAELNLYLAGISGTPAAENTIVVYEGFAPETEDARLKEALDKMDCIWLADKAVTEDNPPIEFKNNRFVSLFEPLTDMYGRPAYNGFDPTPFISVFFLLFFAMCMGDAGYGIVLVIVGRLLKKSEGFAKFSPLVSVLGLATIVVGFLFHTFFSIDISTWECIPDSLKSIMIPSTIAGYDGTMVVAIAIGIVHLLLAMIVKTVCATRNSGFTESLSTWGWTIFWLGLTVIGLTALTGVLDKAVVKTAIIALGIICAIGIFPLNNLHRNPLVNIGSGLWDTYNMATGILGDVLSYLRLYALGLAGSMLGVAFNNLAEMVRGDGGLAGWIPFLLIVLLGHTLNIAMAALGAFVHPLRLNFLEFFKNSGYEATGRQYDPLKK